MLPYAEFCYNITVHSSHQITPFYVNFGYYAVDNYPAEVMESKVPAAEKYVQKLDKLRKDWRETLILANEQMAKYYKKGVANNEPTCKIGDKMMVNGKNIKTIRPSKKLDHKMRGPLKVKSLIGPYACELDIPEFVGRPHPIYHIS